MGENMTGPRIWITNAYDSSNLGDDFLLREVMVRAAIPTKLDADVTVVSNNPDSLDHLDVPAKRPNSSESPSAHLSRRAARGALNLMGFSRLTKSARPDAVLAMAGGYTVVRSPIAVPLFANDHFATLDIPRRYSIPGFMFPVSIGPLHPLIRRRLLASYRSFHTILIRDDESMDELSSLDNTVRVPDLAAQAIATRGRRPSPKSPSGTVVLIGRGLDDADPGYVGRMQALGSLSRGVWRLQVKKDAAFYIAAGLPHTHEMVDYGSLERECDVVVSIRLHGALMSVLHGVPAIHLSYDRKGAGAYRDLGISEWLHSAHDFDPALVAEQARELASDPSRFWTAVDGARGWIQSLVKVQDERIANFWEQL